ncbi:OLC1v1023676C1 [Oldenlandia corymbosa var. corymbosa]|uniref:OLC1v1023676C1 n=1 Tax=Oldenlandia corymbosa var. corymbosa TaxID=529605 RepID=A0AAV1C124_OLDCO|nr:OLC1v1023676C1 [Oldenlandia corymbosa var. corymbosa]
MNGRSLLTSLLNCATPFTTRLSLHNLTTHYFSTNSLPLPPPPEFVKLCSQGLIKEAFTSFTSVLWSDTNLFSHLLKACVEKQSVCLSKQLHSVIITSGCFKHRFVANHLLNAYAKLGQLETAVLVFDILPKRNTMSYNILIGGFIQKGDLDAAFKLFDEMGERNLATWNAMIVGLVQYELNEDGLSLFSQMHELGFSPDVFTLGSVFKGCAGLKDLNKGKQVHGFVVKLGLEEHLIVGNALAHMYMRSGNFREGEKVIRLMPSFSVAACNTLISGMAQNGYSEGAMVYYNIMKKAAFRPDKITFVSVISSCSDLASLAQGQQVHADVIKVGALADVPVISSLGFLEEENVLCNLKGSSKYQNKNSREGKVWEDSEVCSRKS